jgi:hypothetical protein
VFPTEFSVAVKVARFDINLLLVSLLWGSQDASDIREPAKQDGSLRKMAAIGLSKRII